METVTKSSSAADHNEKVITIKGQTYIVFEGHVINETEADKIFTTYSKLRGEKKASE